MTGRGVRAWRGGEGYGVEVCGNDVGGVGYGVGV